MSIYTELGIRPCQVNTITRTVELDKGKVLASGNAQAQWHIYYKEFSAEYGHFSEGYNLSPPFIAGTNWFARKGFMIRRPRVFRVICGASFPRFNGVFNYIEPTEFGPSHPHICPGDTFLHLWRPSIADPENYGYLFQQAILELLDLWLTPYRVTPVLMSTPTDTFGVQIYTPVEVLTPKATPPNYIGGEIYTLYLSMSQSQLQHHENWAHFTDDQHRFNQGQSGFDYTNCPLIVIQVHMAIVCKGLYGDYTIPFGPLDNVEDGAHPTDRQAHNKALLKDHMIESFYYKLEIAILNFAEVQWSTSLYAGPYYFPTQKLCDYNDPAGLVRETREWARFTPQEAAMDMNAARNGVAASVPDTSGGEPGVEETWDISVTSGFSTGGTTVNAVAGALFNKALEFFGYAQWP